MMISPVRLVLIVALCAAHTAHGGWFGNDQNWYNLRTPFDMPWTFNGFKQQPRTVTEAEDAGWTKVDSDDVGCEDVNGGVFWGQRYVNPGDDKAMILIFDVNGFIAGTQSVVPKSVSATQIKTSPMYNADVINGEDVFLITAYFVDPPTICNGGRSQEEFDKDGTGYALYIQNGPLPANLDVAPLSAAEAEGAPEWYKHNCIPLMGDHWFQLNYDKNAPCDVVYPVQLLYAHGDDQPLIGFVWQHAAAPLKGDTWDTGAQPLNKDAVDGIVIDAPNCIYDLLKNPGITTQHIYLKDYKEHCQW